MKLDNKHNNHKKDSHLIEISKRLWIIFSKAIICSAFIWLAEKYIINAINIFNEHFVKLLDHCAFGVIFVLVCIISTISLLRSYHRYKCVISDLWFSWILAYVAIYIFFRFTTYHYVFWGFDSFGMHIAFMDFSALPIIYLSYIKFAELIKFVKRPKEIPKNKVLLRDDAINEFYMDILGFGDIVYCIKNDLNSVDVSKHSFSVGIVGEWGSGKSSFLNLLEKSIHNDIIVRFYPRSSSNLEDIQDDFFKTFSREISHYYKSFSVKISRYIRALKLLEGKGIINKTANIFETLYIDDEKEEVNNALQKVGRLVFVIIEDLDRLTGPEILEVFKLIDRNGNFRNVIYITAYDKRYVNNVLAHNILGHEKMTDYTDKYFNYEFTLPAQKQSIINYYVANFINNLIVTPNSSSLNANFRVEWKRVGQTISSSLSNIRHSKRFINLFQFHYINVSQDINIGDLLLLTLIRYKNIAVYDALSKGFALTKGGFLQDGTNTIIYLVKDYESLLKGLGADNEIISIVKMLFPELSSKQNGNIKYKHIRRSHSFDLYFSDSVNNRLLNKDIMPIFYIENDNRALDILAGILQERHHWAAIEEYLICSDFDFVSNSSQLKRYIKLVILAYHLTERNLNYYTTFGHLFYKSAEEEFTNHMSDGKTVDYAYLLHNTINQMIDRCSLSIGLMINNIIQDFTLNPITIKECLFNSNQLIEIALKCQQFYTENSGETWLPRDSINLSLIYNDDGNSINDTAKNYIMDQFYQHPKEYANSLIRSDVSVSDAGRFLYIAFSDYDTLIKLFGNSQSDFNAWIEKLPDVDMKYVFYDLCKAHNNGENIFVPALQDKYTANDYKSFRKAIEVAKRDKKPS